MNSTFFFEKGVVMKKQFDERNLTMVMGILRMRTRKERLHLMYSTERILIMPDMLYLQVLNRLLNI